ncbi:hypothetical protein JQ557_27475 [Bradyrhizobium sp. U87765 SZCCT0131]|uniref:hypothetical protein n=1 Tax=unclassified Bradyrhizobium TaxID=2631580 RepID=UPI001BAB240F|nr:MULTISPECIES: hypothetical protein [unclassified Bradyrhizobium]MBR1221771.1 hypothetical protein [Bradyrhizobium sp. U87765 SZCCT0131]MBR1264031.1 hypothetical protein [Bradyrhizobium sp. U87765 SZCCT0134]MBR1308186.1 hypothetical protein [Bradyrhizobium sp. U87765 SZCCT0110]MBR1320281.1 hypothetical protein [Bradyrhizobium sp. U87765 SZCCT0109]MBR1348606.1 hypothetical protein [Bradyrhizobium sp. U87765 SZCCT0048]
MKGMGFSRDAPLASVCPVSRAGLFMSEGRLRYSRPSGKSSIGWCNAGFSSWRNDIAGALRDVPALSLQMRPEKFIVR